MTWKRRGGMSVCRVVVVAGMVKRCNFRPASWCLIMLDTCSLWLHTDLYLKNRTGLRYNQVNLAARIGLGCVHDDLEIHLMPGT